MWVEVVETLRISLTILCAAAASGFEFISKLQICWMTSSTYDMSILDSRAFSKRTTYPDVICVAETDVVCDAIKALDSSHFVDDIPVFYRHAVDWQNTNGEEYDDARQSRPLFNKS